MKNKFINKVILGLPLILSLIFSVSSYGDDELLSELKNKHSVSGAQYSEVVKNFGSDEHINFVKEGIKQKQNLLELVDKIKSEKNNYYLKDFGVALAGLLTWMKLGNEYGKFLDVDDKNIENRLKTKWGFDLEKIRMNQRKIPLSHRIGVFAASGVIFIFGVPYFVVDEDNVQVTADFSKEQYKQYTKLNTGNEYNSLKEEFPGPTDNLDPVDLKQFKKAIEESLKEDETLLSALEEAKKLKQSAE